MQPSELTAALARTAELLAAFNQIAKALTSTLEVREVLELVMQKVSALMRPGNWSLLLIDEKTNELYFEIAVGEGAEKLKHLRLKSDEGIAGTVFSTGVARRVDDVAKEPSFADRFDEYSTFRTRSILAVPLVVRGKSVGVIELVNGSQSPPFNDEDTQLMSGIADFAAIAIDNARNFQKVQELTLTDEHTSLYNARHLRAVLEREVTRARRFHHQLSLIFLDLDHFKTVNDTHGHRVGSAVLREVGDLLRNHIRQTDSAFRYGGDEFAIALIETGKDGARAVAERMRNDFSRRKFSPPIDLQMTASIGVATFPTDADSYGALIDAADQAMYRVKARGRNQIEVAKELLSRS